MIDPAIAEYYGQAPEETRLEQGPFRLEEARTRELIGRFAAPPPGTVLDVGGAAGAYALWLAGQGYTVHLVDAAPRLVAEARRRSAGSTRPLASCEVGDARALAAADGSADLVLLLGPLYHLTERSDRVLALREGQHRNPTARMDYFTTAYFHRPEELAEEMRSAGLEPDSVFGIEGPGWIVPDVPERMADPARRETLLTVARLLETEPSVMGCSAHLLGVARRAP